MSARYDAVTEKAWQAQALELFGYHGWKTYHTFDSRRSAPGWPDIFAVHPATGDVLAVELKSEKGRATPEQLQWLAWLEAAGIDAYVWRPSDVDEAIVRIAEPQRRAR